MNLIKHFIAFVIVLIPFCGLTQTISVFSDEDKLPIPSAYIICQSMNSISEKEITTNESGKTDLNILSKEKLPWIITIHFPEHEIIIDTLFVLSSKSYFLKTVKQELGEVIVTAQYAPIKLANSVYKARVITDEKIRAMGAQNLRDVLTNELNIRITQDNVLGSSINLQGISGQNVKILVDGVAVIGRLDGNIDVSQINMNNVERIEIIEGPLSVIYGSDALAGTINIITKKRQRETFSISSNNYYESNGQYNFTGRIGVQKNKHQFSVTGGRHYFDGWRYADKPFQIEKKRLADTLRFQNWKPKEQYFGTLNYNFLIKKLRLGYTSDYFHELITNRGFPQLPYYENAFDDYYTTNRFNNSLQLTGAINKKYSINAVAAYSFFKRIKNTYYKDLTTLNEQLTENSGDQDTSKYSQITARAMLSSTKDSAIINYQVGIDISNEVGWGVRMKNRKQQIGDYAVFGSIDIRPFSSFTIRPGLRMAYNTEYKAPLVPSIHLLYKLKNLAFRFSYARGFRAPSLKELYFDFVDVNHNIIGNQKLKAEYAHNFNFSINKTLVFKAVKLSLDNTYFYNSIQNMISLTQTTASGTSYTYRNVDKFQSLGIQLQTAIVWKNLSYSIGGSYVGRDNTIAKEYGAKEFMYSPEIKSNLRYEWKKQQMIFSFFYKYTGSLPQYYLNETNQLHTAKISSYHTADISVSRYFFNKLLSVTLGCKNLFNVTKIVGTSSESAHSTAGNTIAVGMGRTYFVKLDINIKSKK